MARLIALFNACAGFSRRMAYAASSRKATDGIIALNTGAFADASACLWGLIALVTSERSAEYGGVRAEAAIREWARVDAQATQEHMIASRRM